MVTYHATVVNPNRVRRFKDQPRTYFDPAEIAARAESMKSAGQQTPCTVEPIHGDSHHDYELIDGESRWLSAKAAGLKELLVIVRSEPFTSVEEKHLASLVANFNRSEHTPMEISNALYLQVKAGVLQVNLARMLGKQQMWVSNYLSLQNLLPEIQSRLHPRTPKKSRISPSAGFSLAGIPQDKQLQVLAQASRADGKLIKARIDKVLLGTPALKRKARKLGRARRKIMVENALRAIGSGVDRLRTASPAEAREILGALRRSGEAPQLDSLEDLLHLVREDFSLSKRFPDMPQLPEGANLEEALEHREKLREYWAKKAQSPNEVLLNVAYPPRKGARSWVSTKWHRDLK